MEFYRDADGDVLLTPMSAADIGVINAGIEMADRDAPINGDLIRIGQDLNKFYSQLALNGMWRFSEASALLHGQESQRPLEEMTSDADVKMLVEAMERFLGSLSAATD